MHRSILFKFLFPIDFVESSRPIYYEVRYDFDGALFGQLSPKKNHNTKMTDNVIASDSATETEAPALIESWDTEYNYDFLIYLVV